MQEPTFGNDDNQVTTAWVVESSDGAMLAACNDREARALYRASLAHMARTESLRRPLPPVERELDATGGIWCAVCGERIDAAGRSRLDMSMCGLSVVHVLSQRDRQDGGPGEVDDETLELASEIWAANADYDPMRIVIEIIRRAE